MQNKKDLLVVQINRCFLFFMLFFSCTLTCSAQTRIEPVKEGKLRRLFQSPPESASPWVFWYWLHGAVTTEGITADLEAMKQAGIGGAYLMPIKDTIHLAIPTPSVRQLSPAWWRMVRHALKEAKRLGLKIGMHVSDGFALAGGPWITPELSMQKIVWTQKNVTGGYLFNDTLQQPETKENYYRDIAVFAYPSSIGTGTSTTTTPPKISSSKADSVAQFLAQPNNRRSFKCDDQCWVQYEFEKPFTCRAIIIRSRTNYQSNRLIVQVSDDGRSFRSLGRLEPPRHGWQDWDSDYTHVIAATTARYFRFVFDKSASEPGAEDLDAAKWKPSLRITGIELSSEPRIHQYEGKTGEVWRISKYTTSEQVPDSICVPLHSIVNLTDKLDKNGRLIWEVPPGKWTILRMGHTSTGHRNETGGGGKGLECDKFNPAAISLQFDKWFGEIIRQAGPELTASVLKLFHVDSWECGSQNWSPVFREEFKKRRGYDLFPYLPVMAGIPVQSADLSERFLHDVRQTIAELVNDVFYQTLSKLAHQKGMVFSAESVAPTMLSDGMLHYQNVDIPMGEFWFRSPTHDKPNDMLDAISGAHVYGKQIVQAEAFTQLRTMWDEHPGILKTLLDRNYALGINRVVYHVFMHNPWLDRKPGMTLDGIGLYFQRDQTWWKQGRAWVDYARRCQALLQLGKPVTDIAVFTGEDLPRRAVLPDRLVPVLPGIFGPEVVERERKRLLNEGQPLRQLPVGVTHSANITTAENWIDPLAGYAYDSYNPESLLQHSKVRNGRIELSTGASYGLLVLPGPNKMSPNAEYMSVKVAERIKQFVEKGATVLIDGEVEGSNDFENATANDEKVQQIFQALYAGNKKGSGGASSQSLKGRLIKAPYTDSSFAALGIEPDVLMKDAGNNRVKDIAWIHRAGRGFDIYFISNQKDSLRRFDLSLRVHGKIPEIWEPVLGTINTSTTWRIEKGRTVLPVQLEPNGSLFIVLQRPTQKRESSGGQNWLITKTLQPVAGAWKVQFDTAYGGPRQAVVSEVLFDWSQQQDSAIRYYSGTAVYTKTLNWKKPLKKGEEIWLNLGTVDNIAEVFVNGISCGIAWTTPYRVNISKALKQGKNMIRIEVSNTWANRLVGDHRLPEAKRITHTNAPYRLEGRSLLPAGLLGPVTVEKRIH